MNPQRRLGRGLEALLGTPFAEGQSPESQPNGENQSPELAEFQHHDQSGAPSTHNGIAHLSVYEIDNNPYQPRQNFEESEIDALAQSIRDHGLIQPIVVRPMNGRYQLIAGERRLRAATKAGWAEVPVQIREADDRQVAEIAIVENLQRKDLNALEKATSFQQYLNTYQCTQEELAGRLSIDRSTIANLIRLLELPETIRHAINHGHITAGHARAMLPLANEEQQAAMCQRIQSEELSVRATEQLVQEMLQSNECGPIGVIDENGQSRPVPKRTRSRQIASLEQELKAALGTKVQISQTSKGKGKIVIQFANHDEFDRLRAHLMHSAATQAQVG
ncbi:MAG TPA: ParB/RepB/Spo0J family partition protein [Pirellulales bacterium]